MNNMETDRILKVKMIATHRYEGAQCETVYFARTRGNRKYRWFMGFGGDHRPVSKRVAGEAELFNLYDFPQKDDGSEEYEKAKMFAGTVVPKYI